MITRSFQQSLTFSGGNKSNGAFSEGHYLVVASHNQVINSSQHKRFLKSTSVENFESFHSFNDTRLENGGFK